MAQALWIVVVVLCPLRIDGVQQLPASVSERIHAGRAVVWENFVPGRAVNCLRADAEALYAKDIYSAPRDYKLRRGGSLDRAVLRESTFSDYSIGDGSARASLANELNTLKTQLAVALDRPTLTDMTPHRHEASYTRFSAGASLRYHVDEHHEELKGRAGWQTATRRSISWLVYLNEAWNQDVFGGQLRCFEPRAQTLGIAGATKRGDLQVGWLQATLTDPYDRPIYLDATVSGPGGNCILYQINHDRYQAISKPFYASPTMFIRGGDTLLRDLYIFDPDAKRRYRRLEQVQTPFNDFMNRLLAANPQHTDRRDFITLSATDPTTKPHDIAPTAGTLVLFDSVSLPHEVLETRLRPRFACSGWFHEDQQPHALTSI